jgi:outer membrane protein assembly factor BamB
MRYVLRVSLPFALGLGLWSTLVLALASMIGCSEGGGGEGGSGGSGGVVTFPVPKVFDPPPRTSWSPVGCRSVPADDAVLPTRIAYRNVHSDEANTDEISVALAPVFREGWIAESETFNATGPVFDSDGNLYFSPGLPHEPVVLISLDPKDGERRFTIANTTGAAPGASTPMVLSGPVNGGEPKEMIVLGLYDRAFAVDVDGAVLWDVPTGLTSDDLHFVFGVNYAPAVDAIVGLTDDGFVYALDRLTGEPLLQEPFELPGEKSPAGDPRNTTLPVEVTLCLAVKVADFANLTDFPISLLSDFLSGNNVEVANQFSIDANTSSLWIVATAPDEEDGTVDGISEFGALYKMEFVSRGDGYDLVEVCHASFEGGSSSTPALRKDGSRVYTSDNAGRLIAIETSDCSRAWELDVGGVINGSIAVSSDNDELYANTYEGIVQAIDQGTEGVVGWISQMDAFRLPADMVTRNNTVAGIGANAVSMFLGAGFSSPTFKTFVVEGLGQLDRETGELRYFAVGGETTVANMTAGPDGALYMANSPWRSIVTNCMAQYDYIPFGGSPPLGGITKFAPERLDLLIRDAVCAAADRASNAGANRNACPRSAAADVVQIGELIAQARWAAPQAIEDGDLSMQEWASIDEELTAAEQMLDPERLDDLVAASEALLRACDLL